MADKVANTIKLWVREEDFETVLSFVTEQLNRRDVSQEVANEALLVFEALFQKLLDSGLTEGVELDVSRSRKLGGFNVRVGFEVKPFDLFTGDEYSIEEKILHGYEDKLDCSYHLGYNVINISVSRNYRNGLFACAIAALLAVVAYIPLCFIVTSSVPPSIFEPFEAISPVPLMLIALLVTYALCSAGKHFDALRQAMEACYTLFSRMLHVVVAALPVFCFLAFVDVLICDDFWGIPFILGIVAVISVSLLLLFATYAVRLKVHGVKVIPFVRKLVPLIRENFKIGSSIDAAPYNVRYCGALIVTMYLQSLDVICAAIYCEAFMGSVQNIVNVIGDIVMAAIDENASTDNQVSGQTTTG